VKDSGIGTLVADDAAVLGDAARHLDRAAARVLGARIPLGVGNSYAYELPGAGS